MKPQTSGLVVGKLKRKVLREPVGVALRRDKTACQGGKRKKRGEMMMGDWPRRIRAACSRIGENKHRPVWEVSDWLQQSEARRRS